MLFSRTFVGFHFVSDFIAVEFWFLIDFNCENSYFKSVAKTNFIVIVDRC